MTNNLYLKSDTEEIRKMYIDHSVAYTGDSGLDIYFIKDQIIPAKTTVLIDLGISCEMKNMAIGRFRIGNTELFHNKSYMLVPRSSIYKTPLRQCNSIGIIDSMYRDSLKIAVDNISDKDYNITKGQKLFQIILPTLEDFGLVLTEQLSESTRGSGFGSSNNIK